MIKRSGCVLVLVAVVAGCSSPPIYQAPSPPPSPHQSLPTLPDAQPMTAPMPDAGTPAPLSVMNLGDEIALRAIAMVGKPYRYGGADLAGFDCSGMVYFIHQALGMEVPRTAADQQRAAASVNRAVLRPGDLLFFRTTKTTRISHVGVYVGDNRFVHAPNSGRLIELRALDDQYYGPRLTSTGRFHAAS